MNAKPDSSQSNQAATNCTTWRWNGNNWDAIEVACNYGYVPSHPSGDGSYVGETRVTECIKIRKLF